MVFNKLFYNHRKPGNGQLVISHTVGGAEHSNKEYQGLRTAYFLEGLRSGRRASLSLPHQAFFQSFSFSTVLF